MVKNCRDAASFIGTGFKRYFWRYSLSGTGYADHFRSGRLQPRAGRYSAAGYGQEKAKELDSMREAFIDGAQQNMVSARS